MDPLLAIVWIFVVMLLITIVITLLALVGRIYPLGGGDGKEHSYYLRKLVSAVIIEAIVTAVGGFAIYLANRNKEIAGLKATIENTTASNTSDITDDSTLAKINLDSLAQFTPPRRKKTKSSTSSTNDTKISNQTQIVETLGKANQNPPISKRTTLRETIEAPVYATTDEPSQDTKTIIVPPTAKYVGHNAVITTKNGQADYNVELLRSGERIDAVKISVSVSERSLFGPRNWIGVVLQVFVEREYAK